MKFSLWPILSSAFALFLVACSNTGDVATGDHPTGTGPFDSNGNYREEWADDPSKWRRPGRPAPSASSDTPVIAKNDQPPPDATPLASSAPSASKPKAKTESAAISEASEKVAVSKSRETTGTKKSTATTKAKSTSSTKTTAKAKPKAKGSSSSYVVKKGDTLSAIASRNGTSVSAIRSANRISGTMIRDGQKLIIPKR